MYIDDQYISDYFVEVLGTLPTNIPAVEVTIFDEYQYGEYELFAVASRTEASTFARITRQSPVRFGSGNIATCSNYNGIALL